MVFEIPLQICQMSIDVFAGFSFPSTVMLNKNLYYVWWNQGIGFTLHVFLEDHILEKPIFTLPYL